MARRIPSPNAGMKLGWTTQATASPASRATWSGRTTAPCSTRFGTGRVPWRVIPSSITSRARSRGGVSDRVQGKRPSGRVGAQDAAAQGQEDECSYTQPEPGRSGWPHSRDQVHRQDRAELAAGLAKLPAPHLTGRKFRSVRA